MKMDAYTSFALSQAAETAWTQHATNEKAESLLAIVLSKQDATLSHKAKDEAQDDQSTVPTSSELRQTRESRDHDAKTYLAQSLVTELSSQVLLSQALRAETVYVTIRSVSVPREPLPQQEETLADSHTHSEELLTQEPLLHSATEEEVETKYAELSSKKGACPADQNEVEEAIATDLIDAEIDSTLDEPLPLPVEATVVQADTERYKYIAESMVQELLNQQSFSIACEAEAKCVKYYSGKGACPVDPYPDEVRAEGNTTCEEAPQHCDETAYVYTCPERCVAESMVQELLSQLLYSTACKAEAKIEERKGNEKLCATDSSRIEQTVHTFVEIDSLQTSFNMKTVCDASTITENQVVSIGTSTIPVSLKNEGTSMEPRPLREVGCNTFVNCLDVLRRAKEIEELHMLKAEHLINVKQLNEERSKRMVAEQLVKIVQSDLSGLRQRNVSEVTTRMRLENELGDSKAELSYANKQLEEKEERVKELEESLTGTSLLVRKLEEQNSISLMNRGGIDYMVQAKLAEGRAREAEQKLELVQSELLQSQTEVRVLLDRVGEAAREKTESVSSKVHTQLLQLADERAMTAERRAQDLEREVRTLKEQLSSRESSAPTDPYRTSYGSTFSSLTSSSGFLSQPSLGLSSPYPSTSVGTTYSKPGFPSYDTPSYLLPSSLKSQDYLGKSYDPDDRGFRSHDYLGKSYDPDDRGFRSHDYLGKSYDPDDRGMVGFRSHDYLGKSYEPKVSAATAKSTSRDILGTKTHNTLYTTDPKSHDHHEQSHDFRPSPAIPPPKQVELPLVSSISGKKIVTDTPIHVTNKDDSGSSDWSSSDEEDSGDPLHPSSHRTLISQWEWRAMNKETGTPPQAHLTLTPSNTPPTRRKPPPIAPKPKHLGTSQHQLTFEPPSSFSEPAHGPSLMTTRRVKGPRGRRLPVRFGKQVNLFA